MKNVFIIRDSASLTVDMLIDNMKKGQGVTLVFSVILSCHYLSSASSVFRLYKRGWHIYPYASDKQPTANCPLAISGYVSKPYSVRVQERKSQPSQQKGWPALHMKDQKASRRATALTAKGWKFKPEPLVLMPGSSQ